jgi:hypothetical protein
LRLDNRESVKFEKLPPLLDSNRSGTMPGKAPPNAALPAVSLSKAFDCS